MGVAKLLGVMFVIVNTASAVTASAEETVPLCISLGATCKPAIYLRSLGWRHEAYPFDWITTSFDALCQAIDEDFLYFLTDLKLSSSSNGVSDHYGLFFSHDWPTTEDGQVENEHIGGTCLLPNWEESVPSVREKYQRRIERFRKACLGQEKVVFIRTEYVTKQESILLKSLIKSKWPNLDFILVVIANYPEFQDDWNIDGIRNFYFNVNINDLDFIRNALMSVF